MSGSESNKPEKIILVLIAMVFVLSVVFNGSKKFETVTWAPILTTILLLGYYIFLVKDLKIKGLLFGMVVYQAGFSLKLLRIPNADLLLYVGALAYLITSILFVTKAIKDSLEFKNFELMIFLIGLFLLFPIFIILLQDIQNYLMMFCFGLAFVSATIIYNDNLWGRFSQGERKIIIFQLVNSLVIIIGISLKNF